MPKFSAGLLPFRFVDGALELMLVHPGGPFWAKKDLGAWSIPKGEFEEGETPFEVAIREFKEETGFDPRGEFIELDEIRQPSRKIISAWAFESDYDTSLLVSNEFELEWPPRSNNIQRFPEVDRGQWFSVALAKQKILKGQVGFIEQLCKILAYDIDDDQIDSEVSEESRGSKDSGQGKLF